ncbi:MAG: hypothetical protein GC162_13390 [Planctomycetes bacterium]|nr:hypothetical protein [Planctomycetota bacterium]
MFKYKKRRYIVIAGLVLLIVGGVFIANQIYRRQARLEKIATIKAFLAANVGRDFHRLFPDASYSMGLSKNVSAGQRDWRPILIAKAVLHERYFVDLTFPSTLKPETDESDIVVSEISELNWDAEFKEVESIKFEFREILTADQWKTLVAANGDLRSIGIAVVENHPVLGAYRYKDKDGWANLNVIAAGK